MNDIETIKSDVVDIESSITLLDGQLDKVLAYIDTLKGGTGSLDELAALVSSAKAHAAAVLSEADSLTPSDG